MSASMLRAAAIGGVVMGVLSALPIISAGNICCCLWVVGGGVVAAYVLQQHQSPPVSAGDGALVGLLAGACGAVVYLILSIPVTLILAPAQRAVMERLVDSGTMPPEFREYMTGYVGGALGIVLGFIAMLVAGTVFSTIGGVVGAAVFRKGRQTGVGDEPPA